MRLVITQKKDYNITTRRKFECKKMYLKTKTH